MLAKLKDRDYEHKMELLNRAHSELASDISDKQVTTGHWLDCYPVLLRPSHLGLAFPTRPLCQVLPFTPCALVVCAYVLMCLCAYVLVFAGRDD